MSIVYYIYESQLLLALVALCLNEVINLVQRSKFKKQIDRNPL